VQSLGRGDFRVLAKSPHPARIFILTSTFYTAALERPLIHLLTSAGENMSVKCVPYNQLHTFLLDPRSVIPHDTPAKIVLLLRVEDLIRLELVALDQANPVAVEGCIRAFRERTEQFLDILGRISHVSVALMICPSGRGAYDIRFLGNALRVAEHRIAAELRVPQRHHVIGWSEFERALKISNCFNPSGDRLGHVPFTPAGLDALATFLSKRLDRMPTSTFTQQEDVRGTTDLEHFLAGLRVEMDVVPMNPKDEQAAVNLARHTTHFINWPGRKLNDGGIRALAAAAPAGEAWIVKVRDRFGDYGVSGAFTFGIERQAMQVGLLFLTCPVLGRQVEYALIGWMTKLAALRGADFVEIPLVAGPDNGGLQQLLQRLVETSDMATVSGEAERTYRFPVSGLADRVIKEAPNPTSVSAILSQVLGERIATWA